MAEFLSPVVLLYSANELLAELKSPDVFLYKEFTPNDEFPEPNEILMLLPEPTATLLDAESRILAPLVKLASVVSLIVEIVELLIFMLEVLVEILDVLVVILVLFKLMLVLLILILDSTSVMLPSERVPSISAFDFILSELSI